MLWQEKLKVRQAKEVYCNITIKSISWALSSEPKKTHSGLLSIMLEITLTPILELFINVYHFLALWKSNDIEILRLLYKILDIVLLRNI